MRIGVIGSKGYWGPNIVRVLDELGHEVIECDLKLENNDFTNQNNIDAVCIATPPETHFEIAYYFITRGIPTFIEKPLTTNETTAKKLISANDVPAMVGHTYIFSPAIRKIKAYIDNQELGDICYVDCQWRNLGLFQKHNVVWDLAPHPISIINYLFRSKLKNIYSHSYAHLSDIEDTSIIVLEYEGFQAKLQLSWLDPQKIRQITIVGTEKMLVYDDTKSLDKIKLYNKKVEYHDNYADFGTFNMSYNYGDTLIPRIPPKEPLKEELQYFLECVKNNTQPKTNTVEDGIKVVEVIENADS